MMVLCLPAKPESPAFFDSPDIAGLIVVMHVVEECADFYLLLEIVTGGVPLAEILALGAEYSDRQLLVACRTAFVHWNRGSSEVVSSRSRTPLDARLVEPSLWEVVRDTGEPPSG